MRRNRPADNGDRWLVSYADFVTLLFAFFVVLFAASELDHEQAAGISETYTNYIATSGRPASGPSSPAPSAPEAPPPAELTPEQARLALVAAEVDDIRRFAENKFSAEIRARKIAVRVDQRGLVLSLGEAALFAPGSVSLLSGAAELLVPIADTLRRHPDRPVRLEGHSDDRPIRTEQFPSNWELSSARAIEVLDFFVSRFDLDPQRFSAVGYAEYRPLASNATAAGRAANRRVDVVILSRSSFARDLAR